MYPAFQTPRSDDLLLLLDDLFAKDENYPRDNNSLGQSSGMEIGEDGHFYDCVICGDGGDLLCCDRCPNTYHIHCLDPPLKSIPKKKWECPTCRQKCKICELRGKLLTCDNCCRTFHLKCLDPKRQKRISKVCTECSAYYSMSTALKTADHMNMMAAADGLLSLTMEMRSDSNGEPSTREPEHMHDCTKKPTKDMPDCTKKQKTIDFCAGTSISNGKQGTVGHAYFPRQTDNTVSAEEEPHTEFEYSPEGRAFKEKYGRLRATQKERLNSLRVLYPALLHQAFPIAAMSTSHLRPLFPRRAESVSWSEDELDYLWIGVRRHGLGRWEAMLQDPWLGFSLSKTAKDLATRWQQEEPKTR